MDLYVMGHLGFYFKEIYTHTHTAEDDGFQTPLGLTSGPTIDQQTVDNIGLDQFEQANPFQLLEEEDGDESAFFETYLRL